MPRARWLWTIRLLTPDPRTGFMGRMGFASREQAESRQAELKKNGVAATLEKERWAPSPRPYAGWLGITYCLVLALLAL